MSISLTFDPETWTEDASRGRSVGWDKGVEVVRAVLESVTSRPQYQVYSPPMTRLRSCDVPTFSSIVTRCPW